MGYPPIPERAPKKCANTTLFVQKACNKCGFAHFWALFLEPAETETPLIAQISYLVISALWLVMHFKSQDRHVLTCIRMCNTSREGMMHRNRPPEGVCGESLRATHFMRTRPKQKCSTLSEALQNEIHACKAREETTSISLMHLKLYFLGFLTSPKNGQHPERDRNEI